MYLILRNTLTSTEEYIWKFASLNLLGKFEIRKASILEIDEEYWRLKSTTIWLSKGTTIQIVFKNIPIIVENIMLFGISIMSSKLGKCPSRIGKGGQETLYNPF